MPSDSAALVRKIRTGRGMYRPDHSLAGEGFSGLIELPPHAPAETQATWRFKPSNFRTVANDGKREKKEAFSRMPNILIVDDSQTMRAALAKQLEEMNAQVLQANDGYQGFELARTGEFDLIITDVEMPGMDGFALCEKLKNNPATRSIPIIILSVKEDEKHIELGFRLGAAAYVGKSHARSELRERIEEVLNRSMSLRERTVLVVDDSKSIRNMIADALTQAGFRVITAANGKLALQSLTGCRPDLIFERF